MATSTVIQKQSVSTFIRQNKIVENRPFDYIYGLIIFFNFYNKSILKFSHLIDKNYHVSTQGEHFKQSFKATNATSNIVIRFIYSHNKTSYILLYL